MKLACIGMEQFFFLALRWVINVATRTNSLSPKFLFGCFVIRYFLKHILILNIRKCFIPPPDMSLSVRLPFQSDTFTITNPSQYRKWKTFGFTLSDILQSVSISNFTIAFALVLLEKSVFMVSSSCSLLNRMGESLTMLIHPFSWQMVYVPIIPQMLQGFWSYSKDFIFRFDSSTDAFFNGWSFLVGCRGFMSEIIRRTWRRWAYRPLFNF